MKKAFFIAFIFWIGYVQGQQVSLQQVVGCFGQMTSERSDFHISSTAGEPIITTEASVTYQLTQGFHQPSVVKALDFEIQTVDASCPTSTDGSARVSNISGCSSPYTITWSFGDTGGKVGRLGPGIYAVTVTSENCSLTKEFIIGEGDKSECRLAFFKAFSPNGDGTNDSWEIENIQRPEFSENEIEIFNRWGQSIWSGTGYNNQDVVWTGTTKNGKDLPDGTYFYVARVAEVVYKGYIELTK
jgi:gliding motility-associated-like protein